MSQPSIAISTQAGVPYLFVVNYDGCIHKWNFHAPTNSWKVNNLMTKGFPFAATNQKVSTLKIPSRKDLPYLLFYVGRDNQIYQLEAANDLDYVKHRCISIEAQAPVADASKSSLVSFSTSTTHVMYVGTNGNIQELYFSSGQWHHVNVSHRLHLNSKAENLVGFGPNGSLFFTNQQDNDIHLLFKRPKSRPWNYTNITREIGAAPSNHSPIHVYRPEDSATGFHIVYQGTDNHIHELFLTSWKWNAKTLTSENNSVPAVSAPVGFVTSLESFRQMIFYKSSNTQLIQLRHVWGQVGWKSSTIEIAAPSSQITILDEKNAFYLEFKEEQNTKIYDIHLLQFTNENWADNVIAHSTDSPNLSWTQVNLNQSQVNNQLNASNANGNMNASQNQNQDGNSNADTENECSICLDAQKNCVMVPCGHVATCFNCAEGLSKCPICRGNIQSKLKIFFS